MLVQPERENEQKETNNSRHNTTLKIKDWATKKGWPQELRKGGQFLLHYWLFRVCDDLSEFDVSMVYGIEA